MRTLEELFEEYEEIYVIIEKELWGVFVEECILIDVLNMKTQPQKRVVIDTERRVAGDWTRGLYYDPYRDLVVLQQGDYMRGRCHGIMVDYRKYLSGADDYTVDPFENREEQRSEGRQAREKMMAEVHAERVEQREQKRKEEDFYRHLQSGYRDHILSGMLQRGCRIFYDNEHDQEIFELRRGLAELIAERSTRGAGTFDATKA